MHTAPVKVAPAAAQLGPDGVTHPPFELDVEGRAPGHRHGEAGRGADDTAAGPVGEGDARHPQPLDGRGRPGVGAVAAGGHVSEPGPEVGVAVEAVELLGEGHAPDQSRRLGVVIGAGRHLLGGGGEGVAVLGRSPGEPQGLPHRRLEGRVVRRRAHGDDHVGVVAHGDPQGRLVGLDDVGDGPGHDLGSGRIVAGEVGRGRVPLPTELVVGRLGLARMPFVGAELGGDPARLHHRDGDAEVAQSRSAGSR